MLAPHRTLLAALSLLALTACGSNNPSPADAGGDTTQQPDASAGDGAASDATGDVAAPDAAGDVAADAIAADDGGDCEDLSGAYTIAGACFLQDAVIANAACVTQTGCTATLDTPLGVFVGTVSGGTLTVAVDNGSYVQTCTAFRPDSTSLTVRCEAPTGQHACDGAGTLQTFPGAASYCCDTRAQACGAGGRCTPFSATASSGTYFFTACVPAGTLTEAQSCTRGPSGRVGDDACADGLLCVNYGQPQSDQRTCQRVCANSTQCQANEGCSVLGASPRSGVCRAGCSPRGSECGAGLSCRSIIAWDDPDPAAAPAVRGACFADGTGALDAPCTSNSNCAADLECTTFDGAAAACHATCDASHPCAEPMVCRPFTDGTNPTGIGTCGPMPG